MSYRQKKRQKNKHVRALLCSGVSQRRAAKLLNLNRKSVVRMFRLESLKAEFFLRTGNLKAARATVVQFDDLETFLHSKSKPLSVTMAVEEGSRRILGISVASMAANGTLASRSRAKYGLLPDDRQIRRKQLFFRLKAVVDQRAIFKSDENPAYPTIVRSAFPNASHIRFKGRRGASSGLGELKKGGLDPLFSLNHTCAMLRANINRLFRKTWCTTKKAEDLYAHLVLYAHFHNTQLLRRPAFRTTQLNGPVYGQPP